MPVLDAPNMTAAQILGRTQSVLVNLRTALNAVRDLHDWISTLSESDLTSAPVSMSTADASAILSAVADAYAEYLIHTTGQPPGSYPQASSDYVYAASQSTVIGP